MAKYYISIDVGGTKIAYGVFDENRNLLFKHKHPANQEWTPKTYVADLSDNCRKIIADNGLNFKDVAGMSLVMPSFMDIKTGYIISTTNILSLSGFYPIQMFEANLGIPVRIDNDANVAGLGECRSGAGKDFNDMIYITVSTGIGGGIIINKKIFHGSYGSAGEIGHILVTPGVGALCGCHNRGCIESYASSFNMVYHLEKGIESGLKTKMIEMAGGDIHKIDGRILEEAYHAGDELAIWRLDQMGHYIGLLCYNLFVVLNINCYCIGGGLSFMGAPLFDRIEKTFWSYTHTCNDKVYFLPSKHKGDVGIYGGVELFFDS